MQRNPDWKTMGSGELDWWSKPNCWWSRKGWHPLTPKVEIHVFCWNLEWMPLLLRVFVVLIIRDTENIQVIASCYTLLERASKRKKNSCHFNFPIGQFYFGFLVGLKPPRSCGRTASALNPSHLASLLDYWLRQDFASVLRVDINWNSSCLWSSSAVRGMHSMQDYSIKDLQPQSRVCSLPTALYSSGGNQRFPSL